MPNAVSIRPPESRDLFSLGFSDQFFDEMRLLHDEIERAAFDLFQQRGANGGNPLDDWLRAESELLKPVAVSIRVNKDHLTVTADVPGFSMSELKVHIEGQELRICGKSEKSAPSEKRSKGVEPVPMTRTICCNIGLPAAVNADAATAILDKGVLTLSLPKAQPAKKIEIKPAA